MCLQMLNYGSPFSVCKNTCNKWTIPLLLGEIGFLKASCVFYFIKGLLKIILSQAQWYIPVFQALRLWRQEYQQVWGQQDGSADTGTCCQALQHEFYPKIHTVGRKSTPASCPLTSTCVPYTK